MHRITVAILAVLATAPTTDRAAQTPTAAPPVDPSESVIVLPADGRITVPRVELEDPVHALRVKKCQRLVETFAAYRDDDGNLTRSSFLPYCEDLVSYCEEIEERKGAEGFGATYYWALVYGFSNFGLRCYGKAPGNCTGPFDVKASPRVMDPLANMRHHVEEQYVGWTRGYRGRRLCEYVMLPAAPRDWQVRNGRGRFARTDARFRECIKRGYEFGKLP